MFNEYATQNAQSWLYKFAYWTTLNRDGMKAMYGKAASLLQRGKVFSVDYLFHWLRYESEIEIKGFDQREEFKIPNDFTPIFARYLVRRDPGFEQAVTIRTSKFDDPRLEWPEIDWGM